MPALFKNNATATLAASINTTATTIVLNAGLGNSFPLPVGTSFFYGTLFDDVGNYEIVKCTARTADSLTVVRAQDGTNPLEFTSGDGFAVRPIAAIMNNFVQLDGASTLTGTNTFSGNNTFSGSNTHSGSNSFTGANSFNISPTAPTVTFPDNTTKVATTGYVTSAISGIPSFFAVGTVLLFYQANAPTGWTKVTTQNNKALRVVSGTGGVAGGTTAFSTVFTNQTVSTSVSVSVSGTTAGATLSTAQMPSHTHPIRYYNQSFMGGPPLPITTTTTGTSAAFIDTEAAGGGGAHSHSFSGSGSGSGTSSAITLNVQYIDIILASKD